MSIKVPPTDSGHRDTDDACESLLSEFAPDVPPEVRAALRAALQAATADGVSVELDPALRGEIELDPALSGVIETDPALDSDVPLDPELHDAPPRVEGMAAARAEAASAPDVPAPTLADRPARARATDRSGSGNGTRSTDRPAVISKKSTPGPTLRPPHALVVPRTDAGKPSNRPSEDARAVPGAVESTPAEAAPPIDEPMAEEPMFENREQHDGAEPSAEEASMAESTTQAQSDVEDGPSATPGPVVDAGAESAIEDPPAAAAESAPTEGAGAEPAIEDLPAAAAEPAPAEGAAPDAPRSGTAAGADDLFEAVPRPARHFMALLAREGTLLMPQVMAHLGLVRPKGVGGAIEPIQRVARLIGVELPFEADFAPSGFKRWIWRAAPLSEAPPETLQPIPAPAPQKKKPKARPKVDRSRYKKAWKRSLEAKKRKGKSRGRRTDKRRGAGREAAKDAQPQVVDAAQPKPEAPRVPAAHRDESGNADRPSRRGPSAETRRRRQDRPMPEVFRRANRPASRPTPPRREEVRPRPDDVATRPAAARPTVPRLDRAPADAPGASGATSATPTARRGITTPEERLPLPRAGAFRRRTVGDSDVPVVVIRRRKR